MSIVVAAKNPVTSKIWVGSDSQTTFGSFKFYTNSSLSPSISNLSKVNPFRVEIAGTGQYLNGLIGSTGSLIPVNIIQNMDFPAISQRSIEENLEHYIFHEVGQFLIESSKKFNFWNIENSHMDNTFLVVLGGRIFSLHIDGSVVEHTNYLAIGSGADVAFGAMFSAWNLGKSLKAELACYFGISSCRTVMAECGGPDVFYMGIDENTSFEKVDLERILLENGQISEPIS